VRYIRSVGQSTVRHYCTYFDSRYLFRGLALYRSMARHCGEFELSVLCLDDAVHSILSSLRLPRLHLVRLTELEDADPTLAATKDTRKPHEYYWTCTPSWIEYLLERCSGLDVLTYLDADLYFFADPQPLFDELGEGSVLLLEHRYSPQFAGAQERRGLFNVSVMPFRNDHTGREIAAWWRERCIEWCYDVAEPGRFGDQKYLEAWPKMFPGVRVQQHKGGGLAPWNVHNYQLEERGGRPTVDGQDVLLYHYHSLRIITPSVFELANRSYRITKQQTDLLYRPYLRSLRAAMRSVWNVVPGFSKGFTPLRPHSIIGGLLLGWLVRETGDAEGVRSRAG
jgi:hypothetical protein